MTSKKFIIRELAKLERMNWAKDKKVAASIFPYVLVEAINILKNSKFVEHKIEYTKTGEDVKKLLDSLV